MSALAPFGPDIWTAGGTTVSFLGFPYPTRMAVVRLSSGALWVWSPIALTPGLKSEIDALGPVVHLVSPNKLHHLFLGQWKDAYPQARLYASPGLAKRRRDLVFDATLGDGAEPGWAGEIDQVAMVGSVAMTEIVFFHRESRTAIFADLVQNFRPGWFKGWRGFVARLDGLVMPHGGAPREWRLNFLRRGRARRALARILAWDAERVVIAHGEMTQSGGASFIRKTFRWLER